MVKKLVYKDHLSPPLPYSTSDVQKEMLKLLLLLISLYMIEACLITNCPKGGKRTGTNLLSHRNKELMSKDINCRRCGPGNEGRCIGQLICCGPRIGCLLATPDILTQCAGQSPELPRFTKPCSIGACLSDGICCSTDGCKLDLSCEMETMTDVCRISELAVY